MPSDDDFKRLESELLAIARRIYDAGANGALQRVIESARTVMNIESITIHPSRKPRPRTAGYGRVSAPVRDALTLLASESPEGVDARGLADHFERVGRGPNERQIRAALKTLSITGEAVRASRGRYLPGAIAAMPPAHGENPDDSPSGDLDLAAE